MCNLVQIHLSKAVVEIYKGMGVVYNERRWSNVSFTLSRFIFRTGMCPTVSAELENDPPCSLSSTESTTTTEIGKQYKVYSVVQFWGRRYSN